MWQWTTRRYMLHGAGIFSDKNCPKMSQSCRYKHTAHGAYGWRFDFFCAGGFETLLVWWSCLVERQFYFQELRFVSVGWLDSKLLFRLAELIGSTGSCRSGDCIVSFVRGEGRSWRFQVSLSEFIITLWLCQNSYWTWPFNAIYSWFTNETWWFFIVFCMFTRGYILIQFFLWDIHLRPARIHLIHSESKILIDFAPCTLPHIQAGFPSP